MLRIKYLLVVFLAVFFIAADLFAGEIQKTAVIYNGKYACEDCPEAVAKLAKRFGYDIRYFSRPKELLKKIDDASLVIVGGTEDDVNPFVKVFTPAIKQRLHTS